MNEYYKTFMTRLRNVHVQKKRNYICNVPSKYYTILESFHFYQYDLLRELVALKTPLEILKIFKGFVQFHQFCCAQIIFAACLYGSYSS